MHTKINSHTGDRIIWLKLNLISALRNHYQRESTAGMITVIWESGKLRHEGSYKFTQGIRCRSRTSKWVSSHLWVDPKGLGLHPEQHEIYNPSVSGSLADKAPSRLGLSPCVRSHPAKPFWFPAPSSQCTKDPRLRGAPHTLASRSRSSAVGVRFMLPLQPPSPRLLL